MSSTNKTAHFKLPQWIGEDKPSFVNDLNPAYAIIDDEMFLLHTGVESAVEAAADAAESANAANNAAKNAQDAADNVVKLMVALGVTNELQAIELKNKIDNAVPKHDIRASYFDSK